MRERVSTWRTLQQLKTRRYQRMQDHLSDCRRALEQCDGERAICSQQADACTTRLAAFDAALADTAGAGEPIGIEAILQHQRFRAVLEERCGAAEQALVAATQALQRAHDEVATVQQTVSRLEAQAQVYAEKAARARRAWQAQREAAEEEDAIEALIGLRLHRAARGVGP
ncbi:type III secretion protein HrpB7 [Xanthomonas campestris]|uniref:type III secretion protein HrpB7 n=1 Tax=Xanthomonas campestris TaxID=339 RepID=UPI001F4709A7|nr:type III secretion protein HrpB7 [Xanthomonas campestris]MCF8797749.1 type III secretion protein HrpB7 [Xanthomonas campestris pv. campestris]MCF8812920.1 type III secretion protein HrpB7 [Xanthomonas campestris pv. campestris]MDX6081525.1 type III secretion protein HrpB7 [Xanthomonas campestris pv. incanae]MDX6086058.1 type III secretion protein HrpB7 [Xanthomonas campestris pv. incanae]MDX6139477.1 type III secretion protein HrpB7 [Xanthomonas campestris pv. incanae]